MNRNFTAAMFMAVFLMAIFAVSVGATGSQERIIVVEVEMKEPAVQEAVQEAVIQEVVREVPVETVKEILVPGPTEIVRDIEIVREEIEIPVEIPVEIEIPVEVEVIREIETEVIIEVEVPVPASEISVPAGFTPSRIEYHFLPSASDGIYQYSFDPAGIMVQYRGADGRPVAHRYTWENMGDGDYGALPENPIKRAWAEGDVLYLDLLGSGVARQSYRL